MNSARVLLAAIALTWAAASEAKPPVPATLTARPGLQLAASVQPGRMQLADGAVAYVPAAAARSPSPLLVVLHGAGGSAGSFLDRFIAFADRKGVILLAVQSRGATWDLAPKRDQLGGPLAMKGSPVIRFGDDVKRVDSALTELFGKSLVDPRRMVLLGFSDGASYALSLGLANPQLFSTVVALSPGFVVIPAMVAPSQRIFIAHGRSDQLLPFRVAQKDIAGLIAENGLKPQFRPFDGDHRIDDAALADALAYAFGGEGPGL